ncbi:DUF6603 domain-containing protein [Nocardia sp. BMG111209]|uniref:DUF6603 domain-containing protein n=1 Tax=Nocardia sp. BMG111209 TaxID=1160137 RepID=UPI0003748A54|nr:DUF6603 domain-containing protein [Nocardia sp. BMG111209]
MAVRVRSLRKILDDSGGASAEIPVGVFGFGDGLCALFPDGVLQFAAGCDGNGGTARVPFADVPATARWDGERDVAVVELEVGLPAPGACAQLLARCAGFELPPLPCESVHDLTLRLGDHEGSTVLGEGPGLSIRLRENGIRILTVRADGWQVLCADTALPVDRLAEELGMPVAGARALLPDPFARELPPGSWLLPAPVRSARRVLLSLAGSRCPAPPDPSRTDGIGRRKPLPAKSVRRSGAAFRPIRAVATADGFAMPAGTRSVSERGNGRFGLTLGEDGAVASLAFDYSPLQIGGELGLLPASAPYAKVIGGVLMFSFQGARSGIYGTGMGAYVVPQSGAAQPSFFGYAGIGGDPGIGIPALRLTGVSAGFGWNSRLRIPEVEEVAGFPFLQALDDPGAIGAGDGDPIAVLRNLTSGPNPWVGPRADELWVAGGFGFRLAELISGRAMAVVQTGDEFTVAVLGSAAAEFPSGGGRKYARVAADLQAVFKPAQGELGFVMVLGPDSFVLDPNCRLQGGVAFRAWFGNSPHAGDFVYTVGGYHPNYAAPERYPVVPRVGFDWDLTGSVTVSGKAYLAITPGAAMAGGALDVRFHSGVVRAWCTARVDALVQWKPFHFEVGVRTSIGVSASVKIIFVRITITVEVGVGLTVWGPPTGGEAKVKLWFVSFTIGFGSGPSRVSNELDWDGFSAMLPPAGTNVRVLPQAGLLVDKPPATPGGEGFWEVSAGGFTFDTDTTVPITEVYLGTATSPAEAGDTLDLRPTRWRGVTSTHRVSLTLDGANRDLGEWSRSRRTAAVSAELWGAGSPGRLPSGDGHLVADQLLGVQFTSPAPRYGTSTGFIDEQAIDFDTVAPDGEQPLDPAADPVGAVPRRPGRVIATIAATVAAEPQAGARRRLAAQLSAAGFDLGELDSDLSGYARACRTAFTAEPMLVG